MKHWVVWLVKKMENLSVTLIEKSLCEVRLGEIKAIDIQPSPNYRTAEGEDVNSVNWPKSLALISSSTLTSVIPVTLDSAAF